MRLVCFFKGMQLFSDTSHQNSELDSLRLGLTFQIENTLSCRRVWKVDLWNINKNKISQDLYSNCLQTYYCCDRKSRAAYAQSFALWQQATTEFTCHDHSPRTLVVTFNGSQVNIGRASTPRSHDHSFIACLRHIYVWCCSSHTSRSWWIIQSTHHHQEVATTTPLFYTEPHQSYVLCVKAELRTTFTSWSQHHFVAIGNPEQHMRKASHCGSKQPQSSHAMISLRLR